MNENKCLETIFVDDLNSFKVFCRDAGLDDIDDFHEHVLNELRSCQAELLSWGRANRVTFDPGKESLHILLRQFPTNKPFTILGAEFDTKLLMHDAVAKLVVQAGWRVKFLLKCSPFYSTAALVNLYKSHGLLYMECRTTALYHVGTLLRSSRLMMSKLVSLLLLVLLLPLLC